MHRLLLVAIARGGEEVEHLVLRLLLRVQHLLQRQDLVYKQSVGLGDLGKEFLELLHLLLRGRELLIHNTDVVASCEILRRLGPTRSWRFSADVIQVIFAADSKVGMLKFERLRTWLARGMNPSVNS